MKLIILFLITFTAYANYIPKNKVGVCENLTVHLKPKKDHIKIPSDYNCEYHELKPITQMKEQVESCLDEIDCQEKFELLECNKGEKIKNLDQLEVYCTWERPEMVMPNASLKQAYEAQKAQEKAMKDAIEQAKFQMECGKNVKALLMVRNAPKGLSKGQIKQMVNTYAEIDSLLESGSLATAKDEIAAITPDGTLITEGDKTALMAEIDKCL